MTLYLRKDCLISPTVLNWYANLELIHPISFSILLKRHLFPNLDSYNANPKSHELALKNKSMQGSRLIDIPENESNLVKVFTRYLKYKTKKQQALARSIIELENMIYKFSGEALSTQYSNIPQQLRGRVELVYDAQNNANFKFFEKLFFNNSEYDESFQGFNFNFGLSSNRKFIVNTPLIDSKTSFTLLRPFSLKSWDKLFSSKHSGIEEVELKDLFQLTDNEYEKLKIFFLDTSYKYKKSKALNYGIHFIGHAGILIHYPEVTLLIDPFLPSSLSEGIKGIILDQLPGKIDYVLLTHKHQDHVNLETLLQIRYKIGKIIVPSNQTGTLLDLSMKLSLQMCGFNVEEISVFDKIQTADITIQSFPFLGEHGDLDISTKIAYGVKVRDTKLIATADSKNIDYKVYEYIKAEFGQPDFLFIGMEFIGAPYTWVYGPYINEKTNKKNANQRRLNGCNAEEALSVVNVLKAKKVYVYAIGIEPWLGIVMVLNSNKDSPLRQESKKFLEICQSQNIKCGILEGYERIK